MNLSMTPLLRKSIALGVSSRLSPSSAGMTSQALCLLGCLSSYSGKWEPVKLANSSADKQHLHVCSWPTMVVIGICLSTVSGGGHLCESEANLAYAVSFRQAGAPQ